MTPSDLLTALALDGGVGAVLFIMFLTFRASKRFRSRYWVTRLGGRQSENTRSPLVCTGSSGQQPHASELDSPLRPVAGDEPYEDDGIGPSPMGSSTGLGGGFTLLDDAPLLDSTHPADMAPGPLAWLRGVLAVSEEELNHEVGLDAVAFVRFHTFGLQLMLLLGLLGMPILLPCNLGGTQVLDHHTHLQPSWDVRWTMAHISQRSGILWVHAVCCWSFSCLCFVLLLHHTQVILKLRLKSLASAWQDIAGYTVLVQDIPFAAAEGDSSSTQHSSRTPVRQLLYELLELALGRDPISGLTRLRRREASHVAVAAGGVQRHTVLDFFDGIFPEEVRHCVMVPWVSDVEARWKRTLAIRQRCERSVARNEQAARGSSRAGRPGYPYNLDLVHSPRDELLDSSTRLQGQLDAAVRELRTLREAAMERPARTAFVTFRSRAAAACAAQTLSSPNGLLWTVRPAPPPAQVYWPNLQLRWWQRQVRYMQVVAAMVFVCVWFMVPVTFAQSLTSASSIQAVASYLAPTVDNVVFATLLAGYLPSVVLSLFLSFLPSVLVALTRWQGHVVSEHEISQSSSTKHFYVLLLNVFLGSVLTQTIFRQLEGMLDHISLATIMKQLGTYIPSTAAFFLSYVSYRALTLLPMELCQLIPLLRSIGGDLLRCCCARPVPPEPPTIKAQPFGYHTHIPAAAFMVLVGLVFSTVGPMLVPFSALYFAIGRVVWTHQLTQVYATGVGNDSRGMLWMHMMDKVFVSLLVFQVILIGIFLLKESEYLTLLLPLPPLTTLIYGYFQARFRRAFLYIPISVTKQDEAYPMPQFNPTVYSPPCMRSETDVQTAGSQHLAAVSVYHPI